MTPESPLILHDIMKRISQTAIRCGRSADSVQLIAVSKTQASEQIFRFAKLGILDFGENYVQEWQSKKDEITAKDPNLATKLRWHFIGHLQSNKAELVAGNVEYIHSVDSLKLAQKLSKAMQHKTGGQKILFEINLGAEASKSGMNRETLLENLASLAALPGLQCAGLMAIPPATQNPEETRPYFRQLKSLLDECNRTGFLHTTMHELSMGMSQDFEVAIEEGATMVRIGTALFGSRK